jgi:two-component system cell cycle response regulator DivK
VKKILIVEDNELHMKLCREILHLGGYEVIESYNGIECIEKAVREMPGLILMDIQMPGVDGITAMRRIKEVPAIKDIPVIAITSYAMVGDRERFLAEGFSDYIQKPINVLGLLEAVKKHL